MDSSILQSYQCPVCTGGKTKHLYNIQGFNIVRCCLCTMVYVNPRLRNEEVYDIYRKDYFTNKEHGYENYDLTDHLRDKTFQRWYCDIEPNLLLNTGNALDVGCASGSFLRLLSQKGWDVKGIELDQDMFENVKRQGFDVSNTPLEHYNSSTKFQLITLFDVIEHLPYLNKDLEKLSRLLDSKGSIVLVTPNIKSLQRSLFGIKWFQFKPREHIYYFSPKTLEQVFKPYNLKIKYVSSCGQYADFSFLHNRLNKYGFTKIASLMKRCMGISGWKDKAWYAGTGSMLVILQKTS